MGSEWGRENQQNPLGLVLGATDLPNLLRLNQKSMVLTVIFWGGKEQNERRKRKRSRASEMGEIPAILVNVLFPKVVKFNRVGLGGKRAQWLTHY